MQGVYNAELTETPLESLLQVSTLRSTASPYKHKHNRTQSLFNHYLSQLTTDASYNHLDFSKPSIPLSMTPFTFLCNPITTSPAGGMHASTSSKRNSAPIKDVYTHFKAETWLETRPNSPSSPPSAAADLASMFDNNNDEDDAATESDRPDSPIPYSPFSSPLSTAPSSPVSTQTTLITVVSPEGMPSMVEKRPSVPTRRPKPRDLVREMSDRGSTSTRRKRARSASPLPSTFNRLKRRTRASDSALSSRAKSDGVDAARSKAGPSRSPPSKPELDADAQKLIGPLIQVLALSGKSSLPTSTVVHELLASTPSLRSERTEEAWTGLVVKTMDRSPVFGRAEGGGIRNADNEMVEDEWFYRPEMDEDLDRRGTLGAFQRGGGKRRATVFKKQYYWKPVK